MSTAGDDCAPGNAVLPNPIWPLAPLPSLDASVLSEIEPWIREQIPATNRPDGETTANLRREAVLVIAKSWLIIVLGAASGVLMALRRPAGRWLALALCAWVLVRQGGGHVEALRAGGAANFTRYIAALSTYPPMLVVMVLNLVFSGFTLVYLTRRSVAGHFTRASSSPPTPDQ